MGSGRQCIHVLVPRKQGPEREMLYDWELGQDFRIVHFDHAFVYLTPAVPDTRDVKKHGAVLPKRSLFNIVDEANGREIHI